MQIITKDIGHDHTHECKEASIMERLDDLDKQVEECSYNIEIMKKGKSGGGGPNKFSRAHHQKTQLFPNGESPSSRQLNLEKKNALVR